MMTESQLRVSEAQVGNPFIFTASVEYANEKKDASNVPLLGTNTTSGSSKLLQGPAHTKAKLMAPSPLHPGVIVPGRDRAGAQVASEGDAGRGEGASAVTGDWR